MLIKTRSSQTDPDFGRVEEFPISFFGVPVDDRGKAAISVCEQQASTSHCLTYRQNSYFADNTSIDLGKLCTKLRSKKSILIDCTTLGVVEIIFILRAARKENIKNLCLLYAEPGEYARDDKEGMSTATRFNLTGDRQFSGVHGVALDLSLYEEGQVVFLLGYEEDRLAMLLTQQENLIKFDKYAIFGVPAFSAGWELNSFANHASGMANETYHVHYAGANSVTDCYYKLLEIFKQKGGSDIPTVIAPIGTKPHAIAAALFLCNHAEHNGAGLIYDHPQKKDGRSRLLRRWHVYDVTLPA
ncbi:hypothetical protein HUX88_29230 [Duganella sp. BJB1802]|uniref:hypothetical protein n=1 Tax=unclassified Duganella TaxID=2636909 RepID=UPI000E35152F|nr:MULTISPECIES: hypothetical protein [unclassified Duganella]NVD74572.1 hypothetical protein [Duganella sp. BJB1802]RFP09113.1 hypothetical protein D0T26_30220 [Duganella sp. BJB489]